jgi:malonyl-CoA O-methyltransferase
MENAFMRTDLIAKNFGKFSSLYDGYAVIQNEMAEKLAEMIRCLGKRTADVFEIGCGTGYLSKLILECPGVRNLCLNDISPEMIELATKKLSSISDGDTAIESVCADFRNASQKSKYDLVAANAVFQWVDDLKPAFEKINSLLNAGGCLAFATFVEGTFRELDESFRGAYEALNIPYRRNILKFFEKQDIMSLLTATGFKIRNAEKTAIVSKYPSAKDFLTSVKNIGASAFSGNPVGTGVLRRMFEFYKRTHSDSAEMINATYEILYVTAEKT